MNVNIVMARVRRSVTQGRLAKMVGVNAADMVRIERHEWIPPAAVRQRIAKALRCTEEELFGDVIGAALKGRR